jgi:hypothetical protein
MSVSEENPPVPVIPPGRIGDRFVAVFMTVTLVLFAALVVLVVCLVLRVSSVQGSQHADTITACNLANGNRTQDVKILGDILALPAIARPQYITPVMRAAQDAAVAKVNAEIRSAYALRDCPALYGAAKR